MPEQQQEPSLNIGQYFQTVLHRKWWLIGGLFGAWVIVTAVSWMLPSKYDSDALILIQRQQLSDKVVTPNVQIDLQQRLDTMTQQVLSRSNLTKLIEKYNLYPKQRKKTSNDEVVDLMRKDIKIELVVPGQGTKKPGDLTGFTITYTGPSPTIAQQVTQELTGLFITENIQTTTDINRQATDFLQTELDQAAKDLSDQEAKLREFKSRYLGELPEQLDSNLKILSGLQERFQQATDALSRAQQQELYLQSLLTQYQTMSQSGDVPGTAPQAIEQRLTAMRAELAAMKQKYTDKHPDVVHLEHDIAATEALKKKMEQEMESSTGAAVASQGLSSLAQVKSQLKANELEITNRKKDINVIDKQISDYQSRLNQTPVREQELANIERDHQQSLANYNSLLAKKQAADLASNLVNRQQGEQLQLVDPASLPDKASSPNHFKLSLAGIGIGLALGLGLVVLRELMSPTIYNEEQAGNLVHAPILTAVPSLSTASEQAKMKRQALIQTVAAALLLSIIPLGTAVAYWRG